MGKRYPGLLVALLTLLTAAAPVTLIGTQPELKNGLGVLAPLPRPSIVLLWAIWCAPCRAEIDNLAALSKAAAPLPVIVLAVDGARKSRDALGGVDPLVVRYPATRSTDVLRLWAGDAVGLPMAVAYTGTGEICGIKHKGVDVADMRRWRELCLKP